MSLATFKTYSADRMDVEEMLSLSAFGKGLKAEFVEFGLEVPEYVELQLKSLRRDIRSKVSDKLEAEKKRLQSQLENLKTPQERKTELRRQLAKVNDQLSD